ncbi:FAD-dependent monooxygenase [Jannaschia marina]|uniref:FAD-dependent monooxygenase n=1 Tax=Jannaschia marina TaxID=2741674 RepID=UPI0015C9966B|nr:FAD-dependent monooxygenase [Jannaschia marina]
MDFDTDILIAGGGPAGLSAACVLGSAGHRVTLVDPAPPASGEEAADADLRTTALLQPARDLLEAAGAWDGIAAHGTELWTMRIVDAAAEPPVTRDFEARDMGDAPFGWNVPNPALREALLSRAEALETVDLRFGTAVTGLLQRTSGARVTLSNGTRLRARLVVACDGRQSALRRLAGIGARRVDYGQTALVFAVAHDAPHGNVSIEVHRTGGPFTLVPLEDRDGRPCSAVVWMDDARAQKDRMTLEDAAFAAEVNDRSAGVLGPLTPITDRAAWPITSQLADRLHGRRLVLAAEAAHGMPPIGAQGLNTSLRDIATLRDLCARGDIGSDAMTAAYARARRGDVTLRMTGIDILNRTSIAAMLPARALRARGVAALHDIAPVRRGLMRLGLGVS